MNLAAIADLESTPSPSRSSSSSKAEATTSQRPSPPSSSTRSSDVIDVARGGQNPDAKAGPAIRHSDLLLINKTDLAPFVGADLDVMAATPKSNANDVLLFTDLKTEKGKDALLAWIRKEVLFGL